MINHAPGLAVPVLLVVTVTTTGALAAPTLTDAQWLPVLQRLEETPPIYATSGPGQVGFLGLDGALRTAWCGASVTRPATVVLHIADADAATPVPCAPGCAHYVFAWREGAPSPDCDRPSAQDHALARAIADASRLVEVLTGSNAISGGSIGLIGEGYGATIALAVAALQPDRVRFLIAHEPVAPSECWLPEGLAPDSWDDLDPAFMAPAVSAQTLLIGGDQDPWVPAGSLQTLRDALPGPADLCLIEGLGHCPAAQVPDWENLWQAWAFHSVTPVAADHPTVPSRRPL